MAPFVVVPDPMNRHHLPDPDLLYVSTKCKAKLFFFLENLNTPLTMTKKIQQCELALQWIKAKCFYLSFSNICKTWGRIRINMMPIHNNDDTFEYLPQWLILHSTVGTGTCGKLLLKRWVIVLPVTLRQLQNKIL
jgi:hypothetical protein